MDFFKRTEHMRGLAGDTFPVWRVTVTGIGSSSDYEMRMELEDKYKPGNVVLTKACSAAHGDSEGYTVQLTSTDTAKLSGVYRVHFIMTDNDGYEYRKLVGCLEILDVPETEATE